MKSTCISIIFLLFMHCVKAQHAYIPIPVDSALWITETEDWHEGEIPPPPHDFKYYFGIMAGVDTVVNNRHYDSYYGELNSIFYSFLYQPHSAYSGQWIRQDSAKKVWYMRDKTSQLPEELLYDFSLQIGDTIVDTNSSYFAPARLYPYKAYVDNIDSVFWPDGTWRYRWWIKSDYGPGFNHAHTVQIEGMGYVNNFLDDPFLEFHPLVATTNKVVCFKVKDIWLYEIPNKWNADCDTMITRDVAVGIQDPQTNELSLPLLYPNPVSGDGTLHLSTYAGDKNEKYTALIYDWTGRLLANLVVKPSEQIKLHELSLEPGIYFFIINNNANQRICNEKILIH